MNSMRPHQFERCHFPFPEASQSLEGLPPRQEVQLQPGNSKRWWVGQSFSFLNLTICSETYRSHSYTRKWFMEWDSNKHSLPQCWGLSYNVRCQFIPSSSESSLTWRISNSRNKHRAKNSHLLNQVCPLNLAQCLTIGDCSVDFFLLLTNKYLLCCFEK